MSARGAALGLVVVAAGAASAGCAGETRVVRIYDGRVVVGRYIPPEAYASFLRGVLAEEGGDPRGALTAFVQAASEDEDDPEILSRIAALRCRIDPKDAEAALLFARALALDPTSAAALVRKSRCALAAGSGELAAELARRASAADPESVGLSAFAVDAQGGRVDPALRERAVALTAAHGESAAAWDALVSFGRAHRDAELVARGLAGLCRAAPRRSPEVERGAVALLLGGELRLARAVAAAVADAPRELEVVGPRDATVARLAVDDALTGGADERALSRATRGHVPRSEVAARALALGRRELAARLAAEGLAADPSATGAALVRLTLSDGAVGPAAVASGTERPPALCVLLYAGRLAVTAGSARARDWLARTEWTPMAAHDPLAGPLALELANQGVLAVESLPTELRASFSRARASE